MAMKQKNTMTDQKRERMHNQAIKSEPAAERKRTDGNITLPKQ